MTVSIRPKTAAIHVLKSSTFESNGMMIPITNPAKETFEMSKKYPASFSFLTLFFSLTSVLTFCCSLQLLLISLAFCFDCKVNTKS